MASVNQRAAIVVGGATFLDPVLEDVHIDAWRGQIRLLIGECAAPYSWDDPRRVEVQFDRVLEVRAYRGNPVFSRGELTEAGEEPADTSFVREADGRIRLTDMTFRKDFGFAWRADATTDVRFVWIAADVFYLEFLYSGAASYHEVSAT